MSQKLRAVEPSLSTLYMMVIDAESDADQVITIASKAIGRVERFKFLGSIVTNDSNSSTEINVR